MKTYAVRYDAGTYCGLLRVTTPNMKAAFAAAKRLFGKMGINGVVLHIGVES